MLKKTTFLLIPSRVCATLKLFRKTDFYPRKLGLDFSLLKYPDPKYPPNLVDGRLPYFSL